LEYDEEYRNRTPIIVFQFVVTSIITGILLASGVKRLTNTRFSYSKAEVIMNEYNEKLLEEIKEK